MHPYFPGSERSARLIRAQHRRDRELSPDHVHERFQPTSCFQLHATQPTSRHRCAEHIGEKLRAAHHGQMLTVHQIHGQRPDFRSPTHRCTCSFREHTRGLVPADAAASLDDMLAHVHPSRDQINHLTHLSPGHDRRLHPLIRVVSIVEMMVGLLLLMHRSAVPLLLAGALFAGFLLVRIRALSTGVNADCGCSGKQKKGKVQSSSEALGQSIAVVLLASTSFLLAVLS